MSTYFAILTAVGEAKRANAELLGSVVKITHMAIGDGNGVTPVPNRLQTALVNEIRRAPINTLDENPADPSQIVVEQVIPENVGGWWIREFGLFDADGDLVAIANAPPTYKPNLAEGSGRTQLIRMVLIWGSSATVQLKIDPAVVLATRKYSDQGDALIVQALTDHQNAGDPHPQYATKTGVQHQAYTAFSTAGAAPEFSVAVVPAIADYAAGQRFRIKFHAAGSGADTLKVGELASKQLKQYDSTGAKIPANITANLLSDVEYDGIDFVVLDALPPPPPIIAAIRGAFKKLRLSANGTNANVSISADEIVLKNAEGKPKSISNVAITVTGAASGVPNGLDAGALATTTWYSVWIIAQEDGTTAGLLSLSENAPTLPAGYIYAGRVGWIRTDASANKYPLAFKQNGRRVAYTVAAGTNVPVSPVMATGAIGSYPTTYAAVSVTPFLPPTASEIDLSAMGITNTVFGIAPNNSFGTPGGFTNPPPISVNSWAGGKFSMALESSNIYAICSASFHMTCNGWEDDL